MRARDWKRLSQPVLDDAWRFSGSLAYRVPVGWILHGLLAERSALHPDFYLWMVRMPLFVPTDVVDLSWSERFGGPSQTVDSAEPKAREALAQAAEQVIEQATIDGFVLDAPGGAENVGMQEARAYGLLLEGNLGGAVEVLGRVLRYKATYPWDEELLRRAGEMRSMIEDGRANAAVSQLETWRRESMSALGISPE